ncbi:MAG: hypothetical protein LBC85_06955 [Fibromonadaceae bacterium]|nr:hypothetical protein [Fibromonadaceae bacterium]
MRKNNLTAEDVWAMFAELAESQKETDRQMKETDRLIKELAARQEETDRQMKETDRKMQKTDEKMDKWDDKLTGIDENIGSHAEQFFQNTLEKKLEFGGIKYDLMVPNLAYKGKTDEIEFDIALINGDSIAIIEAKNRIRPRFVKEFAEERMEKFRKYFPEFKDCKAYLGIAGFSFSKKTLEEAERYGVGIVRQVGDSVELEGRLKVY